MTHDQIIAFWHTQKREIRKIAYCSANISQSWSVETNQDWSTDIIAKRTNIIQVLTVLLNIHNYASSMKLYQVFLQHLTQTHA
jgi:hypothetical protein